MVAYILDDRMATSLDAASSDISSSSAFLRHPSFSLECKAPVINTADPMAGRLLRWEIAEQALRIVVCFDFSSDVMAHIEIGSVAGISATQHEAFLRAVVAAYPITDGSTFTCAPLAVPEAEPQTFQVPTLSRPVTVRVPASSRMDTDCGGAGARHPAIQKKEKKRGNTRKRGQNKQHGQLRKTPHAQHISKHAKPRPSRGEPSTSNSNSNSSSHSRHRKWVRSVRVSHA